MSAKWFINGVKAIIGLAIIALLVFLVSRWVADYRGTPPGKSGAEATSTSGPAGSQATTGQASTASYNKTGAQRVEILMDGVNFRTEPNSDADVVRGLNKGEILTLLKNQDNWYKCRDRDGVDGWMSSNPSYSKIIQ